MRCCGRIWTRRASSVTRPGGCWPGWSTSTTRRICRTRRCATTCARRRPEICGGGRAGRSAEGSCRRTHEPGAEARGRLRRPVGDLARGEDQDASCSRCGCRARVRRCTGRSRTQGQEAFLEGHEYAFDRAGWGAVPADPLRQPEVGGVAGAVRPQPARVGPLGGVPVALRVRRVLLPARRRGRAREGRGGGRGWPVPPQPSASRCREVDSHGRAQRAAGGGGRGG